MTRRESRWITVVIIALVVILRAPTLLPSICLVPTRTSTVPSPTTFWTADQSIIRQWIRSRRGYIIFTRAFFASQVGTTSGRCTFSPLLSSSATALVVRRIGARVGDEWAGAWSGIGYAVFVHAYLPGDTLAANTEIFASLLLALSVLAFLQGGKEAGWGWMFLSGTLVGAATLIRQPSAVNAGVMLACLVYAWLLPRTQSFGSVVRAGSGIVAGFIAPIAGLALYYQSQGNLHDAYLWAWVFAIRYVESETTLLFVLEHLATVHLAVILVVGFVVVLWHPPGDLELEIIATHKDRVHASGAARFVVGRHLSDNLYWVAVSRALSSDSASASVDSRGPGVLALYCETAAFSSTALAMGPNGHHRRGRRAGDRFISSWRSRADQSSSIFFRLSSRSSSGQARPIASLSGGVTRNFTVSPAVVWRRASLAARIWSALMPGGPSEIKDRGESVIPGSWEMFQADWEAHPPVLIIDMSTVIPDWRMHPMTRYPALRAYLAGYRAEGVINGATIYRRL